MTEELIQRSDEWFQARVGSLGASCIHEVIAKTKSGWSASRANRMASLICERLTGAAQDTYQNAAMLQGIQMEPEARAAYVFYQDVEVKEVGLVRHPKIPGTHASPDGYVGDDGLLEIKCPQPAAHLAVLTDKSIPGKYVTQMQWQMACSGRAWCDFVSYNAAFPEHLRLFCRRVHRDNKAIAELEFEVNAFLTELDATIKALTETEELPMPTLVAV